jgi:hypothetical protein
MPGAKVSAVPARVSQFTPPYWVQFLPDAFALPPQEAHKYAVRWEPFDEKVPNDQVLPVFDLIDPASGQPVDPTADPGWALGRSAWPPGEAPDNTPQVRFVRRLLLTQAVRDVRGQPGQERYLGLYGPAGGRLHCLHRSPVLAPFEREQLLPRLVVRVVEFQVDALRADNADRWGWAELFDPPNQAPGDDRTADAPARVTRVSRRAAVRLRRAAGEADTMIHQPHDVPKTDLTGRVTMAKENERQQIRVILKTWRQDGVVRDNAHDINWLTQQGWKVDCTETLLDDPANGVSYVLYLLGWNGSGEPPKPEWDPQKGPEDKVDPGSATLKLPIKTAQVTLTATSHAGGFWLTI